MRHLFILMLALAAGACASTGGVPAPFPMPRGDLAAIGAEGRDALPDGAAAAGYAVSGTALALRGVPYRNGGADPSGFDCSGFVLYVFSQHGVSMPRTVADQFRVGTDPGSGVQPGDLVFFTTIAPGASHVGIAIGGDEFVHAPSSNGEVRVERMSSSYWSRRYIGARRIG